MLGGWSSTIDPIQLADQGAHLVGELPLKGMSRLAEMCLKDSGSVAVDLHFEHDAGDGVRVMYGTIAAHVELVCQRCMRGMSLELKASPHLLLLRPGEREDLLETGDAIVVEQPVALGTFIEDELLLQMPMVPVHAASQCPVKLIGSELENNKESRPNPFSVLKDLKRTDH